MAKRTRKISTSGAGRRQSSKVITAERNFEWPESRDYKDVLKNFITSPALKYVAGGMVTALLARFANNMTDRYPEISNFIKENLENIEGKLGEFRMGEGEASSSRH